MSSALIRICFFLILAGGHSLMLAEYPREMLLR